MRVLLINPSYPFEEFPRLLVTLPYVASALRAEGHEVEILDLLLARTTADKIERRMERFRPDLVVLRPDSGRDSGRDSAARRA